jgi:hypothetical protein
MCCTRVSAKSVNQREFHVWEIVMKKLKRKQNRKSCVDKQ